MSAVPLPEPGAAYQYLFNSYYGPVWRNDSNSWNGSKPIETRLLYTADQLRAYGDAREAAAVERLLAVAKRRADHEASAAAHHSGTWHEAYQHHLSAHKTMRDLIDAVWPGAAAIRATSATPPKAL